MVKSKWIKRGGFAALAVFLSCKGTEQSMGPAIAKTCSELGDSMTAADTSGLVYHVIQPNGGEIFRVGDTMHVRITANTAETALPTLLVGGVTARIPGLDSSFNALTDCDLTFAIPESLSLLATNGKVSSISDSVKVRAGPYFATPGAVTDLSDGFFSIKAGTP